MGDKYEKENYIIQYDLNWRRGHIYSVVFEENKDLMKGKILYLGCNNGTSTAILSQYCEELVGVDINNDALEEARKLIAEQGIKNTKFVNSNILKMPFEDNSFDGIYAFQILEHIYPEDMDIVLKEIKRILKPNGRLIAEFPTPETKYYDAEWHVFFFKDEEKIKEVFERFFKIEKIYRETRTNPGRPLERHNDWRVFMVK